MSKVAFFLPSLSKFQLPSGLETVLKRLFFKFYLKNKIKTVFFILIFLKTTGVFVIHQLLPRLLLYCPTKNGASVLTSDTFKNLLSRAGDLMQSSFWRSSGEGTAGALGTSQKTFATIATLIVERIASRGAKKKKASK